MRECITAHSHIQICSGSNLCRNAVIDEDFITAQMLSSAKYVESSRFPSGIIEETPHRHRFFSASVSFCPNACSRPQIADFGVIAASNIVKTDNLCNGCNSCMNACRESAIDMSSGNPEIISDKCVQCGSCVSACPSGTLISPNNGFRVLIGGRMGRHPGFAAELPGIYNSVDVIEIFKVCYSFYVDLFDSDLRFNDMILRYPERLPLNFREKFINALTGNDSKSDKIISNAFTESAAV